MKKKNDVIDVIIWSCDKRRKIEIKCDKKKKKNIKRKIKVD